jgi:hypothetical protein
VPIVAAEILVRHFFVTDAATTRVLPMLAPTLRERLKKNALHLNPAGGTAAVCRALENSAKEVSLLLLKGNEVR